MRRFVMLALLLLMLPACAAAGELEETIGTLDLSSWQAAIDESGAELNAAELIGRLARGEAEFTPEAVWALLWEIVSGEAEGMRERWTALMGPALLWAVSRHLMNRGRLGASAEYACYLAGACVMLASFGTQMELAGNTVRRIGRLTEQAFPVIAALMSAAGHPGSAGAVQPMAAFGGGVLTAFAGRILTTLCPAAAILAAAGNLSGRISLNGLFRLCISAGKWLLGAVMTVFLAMTSLSGLLASARDGAALRAAKYAADNLLPVVGGDVADAMGAMMESARLVKSAAGVTGVIVMLSVCLRPVISIALYMIALRLAAAMTEPVAGGPLKELMEQMSQAAQLMLASVAVSASLFITLTGVCLSTG